MSKIVLVVAIIAMIMTMGVATADKGVGTPTSTGAGATSNSGEVKGVTNVAVPEVANKATAEVAVKTESGAAAQKNAAGREYLIRAWGRYGPVSVGQGSSRYWRIGFPTFYGPFLGSPAVTDSLDVRFPYDSYTTYSLGLDRGYTYSTSFDARLMAYSGSLTNAYIDWIAVKG